MLIAGSKLSGRLLHYRAGKAARRLIRDNGFNLDMVRVLAGPASGPKWLVLAALDQALIRGGLFARNTSSSRLLLIGASAGAWRMLTLASPEPSTTHRALLDGYVEQVIDRHHTPDSVSELYRRMLSEIFPPTARARIVHNACCDVAVHITRVKGLSGSRRRAPQLLSLGTWAGLNWFSPRFAPMFYERVLMHSRPDAFTTEFAGTLAPLTADNLLDAAMASGSVPMVMAPVSHVAGAPPGRYLDGGLADYHLNQSYASEGLVLFPHFQQAILPGWFDRYRTHRRPHGDVLANVLQLYPSPDLVARLPDGRIPTRDDFVRFLDQPAERIRRWRRVLDICEPLGEQLLDDIDSGRIPDLVQEIDT